MLPRSQRLSTGQLNAVLEKGKIAHAGLFTLRYTAGNADTRLSAVTSKKIGKTAVARSISRRMIYAAAKTLHPLITKGSHMIIFAKTPLKGQELAELTRGLKDLFVKAGLLV